MKTNRCGKFAQFLQKFSKNWYVFGLKSECNCLQIIWVISFTKIRVFEWNLSSLSLKIILITVERALMRINSIPKPTVCKNLPRLFSCILKAEGSKKTFEWVILVSMEAIKFCAKSYKKKYLYLVYNLELMSINIGLGIIDFNFGNNSLKCFKILLHSARSLVQLR